MADYLLHQDANGQCPHAAKISMTAKSTRVKVGGLPVLTTSDTFIICGCPFTVSGKAQPCTGVQWLVPASRVRTQGQPVLLKQSQGLCQSAEKIPQGPANILSTQVRVRGS